MYLGLREANNAVAALEQALSIYARLPGTPNELAEARFALARSLKDTGGGRERWLSLASSAHEAFAAGGPMSTKRLAEVDAWLAGKLVRTP